MKIVKGNLIKLAIEGEFDVIIHGCNCFHTMGAGIAKDIKNTFPEACEADISSFKYGDVSKLGNYSCVEYDDLTVVNAYIQYKYSRAGVNADYSSIRKVFRRISKDFKGKRVGIPKIGAGLAGGDWNIIRDIIIEELKGFDLTLVIL